jgi:putative ABC transport system permease protein
MMAILWPALKTRAVIALVTFLLSAFAAAAAAAGPLYGSAAMRESRTAEVQTAPIEQRIMPMSRLVATDAEESEITVPVIEGFRTVYGWVVSGTVEGWPGQGLPVLVSRTGACEHLRLVSGRCPAVDREAVISAETAGRLRLSLGGDFTFQWAEAGGPEQVTPITVVGTYGYLDATDEIWANRSEIFTAPGGPIFVTDRTATFAAARAVQVADLIGSPAAFMDLPGLKAQRERAVELMQASQFEDSSEIEWLIERIERSDQSLQTSLVVAVAPLILLSWMVLFLAVTGAVQQRRGELGLAALRGVPVGWRWLLPGLETLIPVLAGAIPGYFLGYLAVQAIADGPVSGGWLAVAYVAVAIGGALIAGAAAQVRALTSPVLSLLRRAGITRPAVTRQVIEAGVAVLAVAAGSQAAFTEAGQGGVGMLAPVCFALGLGLLAARLLSRPANRAGRWALRRGLIRTGLIALSLARRPGTAPVVVLLTIVFGIAGFALSAADTSGRAWAQRAEVELGAHRVITVDRVRAPELLAAVAKADPEGVFAMAAANLPGANDYPVLGVDSRRLEAVVGWPDVAGVLRPAEPRVLTLRASEIQATVTLRELPKDTVVALGLRFSTTLGVSVIRQSTPLVQGEQLLRVPVEACKAGCRLDEIEVKFLSWRNGVQLTVGELRDEAGTVVVPASELGDVSRWVSPATLTGPSETVISGGAAGLSIALPLRPATDSRIFAVPVPGQLPMAGAGELPRRLNGSNMEHEIAGTQVPLVPRFGQRGALMDLEYLDLGPGGGAEFGAAEVWLNDRAPGDVVQRLRDAGLTILDDRSMAGRLGELNRLAPALSGRFLSFAAFGALLLAAGALLVGSALERDRPEDGLRSLRGQGVSPGVLGSVATGTRWVILTLSALLGLLAAALSWWVARDVVPVFTDPEAIVAVPVLPGSMAMAVPLAVALLGLGLICWLAGRIAQPGRGRERSVR